MSFIEVWQRFRHEQRAAERLEQCRKLSTEELKAAWDAFDGDAAEGEIGYFWPDTGPHIEDVNKLLNERGEGEYCAV